MAESTEGAKRLREQLRQTGKSDRALAELTGLSRGTIGRFLKGEGIRQDKLEKLANILETAVA